MEIQNLKNRESLWKSAAQWFHEKWNIPAEAYLESMQEAQTASQGVPQWYVAMDGDRIAAGVGVIENDFHQRPDLRPNLCALYVSPKDRKKGIARKLVDRACRDLAACGIDTVYLITDHRDGLYESLGWSFYGEIPKNNGSPVRMYMRCTSLEEGR